jgi:hypothetical protein
MGYTLRSVGSPVNGDGTLTPGYPAGRVAGDLLLVATVVESNYPVAVPGWTVLFGHSTGSSTDAYPQNLTALNKVVLYGRICTADANDAWSMNWNGTGYGSASMAAFSGDVWPTIGTIVDSCADYTSGNSSSLVRVNALTVNTNNCLIIDVCNKPFTANGLSLTDLLSGTITNIAKYIPTPTDVFLIWGYQQQQTKINRTLQDGWSHGTDAPAATYSICVSLKSQPAATKKLKLLAHSSAASASGVSGVVFSEPTSGGITGTTRYGEFTGATFEATLESGKAVLKVPVADFGGTLLTIADMPVAFVRNGDFHTDVTSCTVIEE